VKTLHLRRSAGSYMGIGDAGMKLASLEGGRAAHHKLNYGRVFCSLIRNSAETAIGFLSGYSKPLLFCPVIPKLGDRARMDEIDNPGYQEARADGQHPFDALFFSQSSQVLDGWLSDAARGIYQIFLQTEPGETVLAFGHSPLIQLAVSWLQVELGQANELTDELKDLAELEGVVLVQDDDGKIFVGSKIAAETVST